MRQPMAHVGCIGIQGAPVDVRELLVPCTKKSNRECCGHHLCTEHYRHHKAGVHPPKWKRRKAARRGRPAPIASAKSQPTTGK